MANIGDLVTTLVMDTTKYDAAPAIGQNNVLGGSIDSIIGKLLRQKKALENTHATTRGNILNSAATGAPEGQVNAALNLQDEIEKLQAKAAADRDAAQAAKDHQAAKNASAASGANLLAELQQEAALLGKTAAEARIYRAELANVNPATISAARAMQEKNAATQAALDTDLRAKQATDSLLQSAHDQLATLGMTAAELRAYRAAQAGVSAADIATANAIHKKVDETVAAAAADARGKQAGDNLIKTLQQEKAELGMTANELAIYRARQAGASEADIARARTLQAAIAASSSGFGGMRNKSMLAMEGVRGLEDAVAGFSNNGLKGMLMGVTNNITQLGALAGGTAGLALGVAGIGALIAVSLVPKLIEWANDTKKITEAKEELAAKSKRAFDQEMDQAIRIHNAHADNFKANRDFDKQRKEGFGNAKEIKKKQDAILDRSRDLTKVKEAEELRQKLMLKQDPNAAKKNTEFKKKTDAGFDDWMDARRGLPQRKDVEFEAQRAERKKSHERLEDRKKEFQKSKAIEEEAVRELEILGKQKAELEKERQRRTPLDERASQLQAERELEEEEGLKWLAHTKKLYDMDKQLRKDNAATTMDLIRKQSPLAAELLEKRIADDEQRKLVTRGLANGAINQTEADKLNSQIGKKDVVPLGGSAAATQSGTTAAYSSIVRAMQVKREDTFAKQQLEKTQDLVDIQRKLLDKEPIKVNTLAM